MCLAAEDQCKREGVEGVAVIGNYLYPNTVAVSGSDYALNLVSDLVSQNGGRAKRLKVAGAFHSPLMGGASDALRRVLGLFSYYFCFYIHFFRKSGTPTVGNKGIIRIDFYRINSGP